MNLADTSLAVAAFASWHESHEPADRALTKNVGLVAHCAAETFSVLTRLPSPHRVRPSVVRDFLTERFRPPLVALDGHGYGRLLRRLVEAGITGGATYDAVVAATAVAAGATLLSCDARAASIYRLVGVDFRLIG